MRSHNGNGNSHKPPEGPYLGGEIDELHDFFMDAGVAAERSGELQSAVNLYEQAVRRKPDSALAWYNFGDALLALQRFGDAVPPLRAAVKLSPKTALFHYDLGLALYGLGRHEEASMEFALIVETDPQLKRGSSELVVSSMTNLALCLDELGRPDEAVKILGPAGPKAASVLYNLARFNYKAKRLADALPLAQAAELLAPRSEDVVHLLGSILMELKRQREAVDVLRRATTLKPPCAYAWYDLGVTLALLNQRKKARPCFQRSLRLAPNNHWTFYALACLDALERKRDKAFANLDFAIAHGFWHSTWLRRDGDLRGLHSDPRWKVVVRRVAKLDQDRADNDAPSLVSRS